MEAERTSSEQAPAEEDPVVQWLDRIWKQQVKQTVYLMAVRRGVGICAVILLLSMIFGVIGFIAYAVLGLGVP